MKRHVDFLALLYLIWGGLFLLVGIAGFALSAGAAAIVSSTGLVQKGASLAAGITAITLAVVAALAVVWAALHLWAGSQLRRAVPWARLIALGLAVINIVLLPFGTALGIYACWVLLTDEGRRLFEPAAVSGA
ncbi:MAG: hypothetical protein Q8L86_14140 [Vicinamibacterales bacterium]|nr:hypothetical protein [Vicinamibacterales bacterium]